MAIVLYCMNESPNCRSVYLTARALGIHLERKITNLIEREHITPEFLKLNPQHTIPTLKDGNFVIWDSHAITAYLIEKYGRDHLLYPENLQTRTLIDQRRFFEASVLFPLLTSIVRPIVDGITTTIPKERVEEVTNAYEFLEGFLEGRDYLAGDAPTLADIHNVTIVTQLNILVPISTEFTRLTDWIKRMEGLPYYCENQEGLDSFSRLMDMRLSK